MRKVNKRKHKRVYKQRVHEQSPEPSMTPTNKRIGCWSYVGHHHFTSFIDFTGETGESGEMVIAADWSSRRPTVAAQEMSGWWSLTSTTKADSARLCSAGAQRHRGWKKAQRWKKSTGGVGKYFTLNITAVYKRCDPGNTSEDYPKYRVSFVCLFLMCLPPF